MAYERIATASVETLPGVFVLPLKWRYDFHGRNYSGATVMRSTAWFLMTGYTLSALRTAAAALLKNRGRSAAALMFAVKVNSGAFLRRTRMICFGIVPSLFHFSTGIKAYNKRSP